MESLKKMREEEISRITVQFFARDSDEKQKLNMKKIFRFLFARKEGEKAFYQCLKDKMVLFLIFSLNICFRAMIKRI